MTVLTGAGISTNAGIPDFRGPRGIWTSEENEKKKKRKKNGKKQQKDIGNDTMKEIIGHEKEHSTKSKQADFQQNIRKRKRKEVGQKNHDNSSRPQMSFDSASPTKTHHSLTRLAEKGIVKYVITQNVDGLHMRSGLPRSKHAILHGCIFTEKCDRCGKEFFRDFDVGGVSFQRTGRKCTEIDCNGDLRDTILDWEDELPETDWELSQYHCSKSDLVLAVGTSLRIEPGKIIQTQMQFYVNHIPAFS